MNYPAETAAETFIVSHLQFMILDRYGTNMNWFLLVTSSMLVERPLPQTIKDTMHPDYEKSLRKSYQTLFEYAKMNFPNLTYSQFQQALSRYTDHIHESQRKESQDDVL